MTKTRELPVTICPLRKTKTMNEQMEGNIIITKKQREEMLHCIGLDWKKHPYRNKFYTQCTDANWLDLEAKGLAKHTDGWEKDMWYFYLTKEGFAFLGIDITDKGWEDL